MSNHMGTCPDSTTTDISQPTATVPSGLEALVRLMARQAAREWLQSQNGTSLPTPHHKSEEKENETK